MANAKIPSKAPKAKSSRPHIFGPNPAFATVIVGKEEKRFVIHEHLLTYYSDFFRAALTGRFKEAEDKTVKLPEDESQTFEFFVHWLYYQRFPDKAKSDVDKLTTAWAVNGEDDLAGETKSINLIRLHLFSDKYQVPQLSKETLDDFFHHLQLEATALAGPKAITEAYNSLDENSPFVRLLVDTQCCTVNSICKVSEQYIWPAGYLWNMIHRHYEIIR